MASKGGYIDNGVFEFPYTSLREMHAHIAAFKTLLGSEPVVRLLGTWHSNGEPVFFTSAPSFPVEKVGTCYIFTNVDGQREGLRPMHDGCYRLSRE